MSPETSIGGKYDDLEKVADKITNQNEKSLTKVSLLLHKT